MTDEQSHRKPTEKLCTRKRCVNLDWLEVHCREPIGEPHNADYFRAHGCEVQEREYGTRVYKEMFVILGEDGLPAIEVRRNPSSQGLNGIHDAEETHLRLNNRLCYFDECAVLFKKFLDFHHYTDIRISRIDICLDFVTFDFGDDPSKFVRRYLKHHYAKINQGEICVHGKDAWEGQEWNSLKWGNPLSIVSTKMYNKTLELKDHKSGLFGKPYIRQSWLLCGFIDDMQRVTKDGELVNVWRVEFSVKSPKANWATIELNGHPREKYSLPNSLEVYKSRLDILTAFASLSRHYFRFKKYKKGVRKDRCEDKKLFDFSDVQNVYKLTTERNVCGIGDKNITKFNRLLQLLQEYDMTRFNSTTKEAAQTLISSLKEDMINADLVKPWDGRERAILRAQFVRRLLESDWDSLIIQDILKSVFGKSEDSVRKLLD